MRLDLVKGFHTLVADFAATGEGYLGGWRSARWAMATRVAGNLRHWRDAINRMTLSLSDDGLGAVITKSPGQLGENVADSFRL